MLTVDMILAMSEDELRARFTNLELLACVELAENHLGCVTAQMDDLDSDLSALAAETVPEGVHIQGEWYESTGTAVDEVYDFEVETEDGLSHNCCPVCGGTDLVMRKGRWQCEPCEERIYQSGF